MKELIVSFSELSDRLKEKAYIDWLKRFCLDNIIKPMFPEFKEKYADAFGYSPKDGKILVYLK